MICWDLFRCWHDVLRLQGPVKKLSSSRSITHQSWFSAIDQHHKFYFCRLRHNKKGRYLCVRAWETDGGELQIYFYVSRTTGWSAKVVRSLENVLPQVLCDTYLCISVTEDIPETLTKWFKNATVCAFECWLDQRAVNLTQKCTRGEKKITPR